MPGIQQAVKYSADYGRANHLDSDATAEIHTPSLREHLFSVLPGLPSHVRSDTPRTKSAEGMKQTEGIDQGHWRHISWDSPPSICKLEGIYDYRVESRFGNSARLQAEPRMMSAVVKTFISAYGTYLSEWQESVTTSRPIRTLADIVVGPELTLTAEARDILNLEVMASHALDAVLQFRGTEFSDAGKGGRLDKH